MSYSSFGWKGRFEGFLLGNRLYTGKGAAKTPLDPALAERARLLPAPDAGSLSEWTMAASYLFAPGCEAQAFMLLASFAAPLMTLFLPSGGGGTVSLYGGRRAGKSTALAAAESVWCRPGSGALTVSRPAEMTALQHLPIVYPTLINRDPVEARATMSLSVDVAPSLILSASGMALKPEEYGIEFKLSVPRGLIAPKDKNRIERLCAANAGWAGDAYLRELVQPGTVVWARRHLASRAGALRDEYGMDDRWDAQVRIVAAVTVASMLVTRLGILEFETQRIAGWAAEKLWGEA